MEQTLQYREGNTADLASMQALALAAWSRFEPMLTEANWQLLYNNLNNPHTYASLLEKGASVVVEVDGRLVGMAFWLPSGNPDAIYQADWSQIRFVTVHPDYAGKGMGRALTHWCIERAQEHHDRVIALHTSEMMDNARHIYESMGFVINKELEPRLGKRYWLYTMDL